MRSAAGILGMSGSRETWNLAGQLRANRMSGHPLRAVIRGTSLPQLIAIAPPTACLARLRSLASTEVMFRHLNGDRREFASWSPSCDTRPLEEDGLPMIRGPHLGSRYPASLHPPTFPAQPWSRGMPWLRPGSVNTRTAPTRRAVAP